MASDWQLYSKERPTTVGFYLWRSPLMLDKDVIVEFSAEFRLSGTASDDSPVLSPAFDYWDGYQVHVPPCTEWHVKSYSSTKTDNLDVVGLLLLPCPFCGETPVIEGRQRASGSGIFMKDEPYAYNNWNLMCCKWINVCGPHFTSPLTMGAEWNTRVGGRSVC